ncbi:MAG: hypothetical protein JWN76_135 [Chitinophagaceae bacterium]|nr:hypothetical protein [Chitinophagaceae bacterium]
MEFKTRKATLIILYVVIALMMIGAVFLISSLHKPISVKGIILFSIFSFLIFIIAVVGNRENKTRLLITDDNIIYHSGFSKTEIPLEQIKGYRITPKYVQVIPFTGTRRITVTHNLENYKVILSWLKEHYEDLDEAESKQEYRNLLSDTSIGVSEEERISMLATARKIALAINIGCIIISLLALIFPGQVSLWTLLLCPFISLMIADKMNGLIRVLPKHKSIFPNIIIAFMIPAFVIWLAAMVKYKLLDTTHLWMPVMVAFCIWVAGIYFTGAKTISKAPNKPPMFLVWVLSGIFYAFGSVILINGMYGRSAEMQYTATIANKYIENGKSKSYHLTLISPGIIKTTKDVSVDESLYARVYAGNNVHLHMRKGYFNIPWFWITN